MKSHKSCIYTKHEIKNGEAFTPEQEKAFVKAIKGSKY